jgi:hypothetical protein
MPVRFQEYVQIGSGVAGGGTVDFVSPPSGGIPSGGVPPQCLTIGDDGNPAWLNQPVDWTAYTGGLLAASAVLMAITVQRVLTFPAAAAFGLNLDIAATSNMVLPVKEIVSNVTLGNLIVMAGSQAATWSAAGSFSVSPISMIRVLAPSMQDATAAGAQVCATALR